MLLKILLALISASWFTECICTYCCDTDVPPEEAVSVRLIAGTDSVVAPAFLMDVSVIAESEGRLDTLKATPQGQHPDRVGFQAYLGNPDSVTVHVMYRDSLIFTSTYLTPKTRDRFNVIRFSTDSAMMNCEGIQAIALDSGATLFVCKQTDGVQCL
jgi:hypothetical protein